MTFSKQGLRELEAERQQSELARKRIMLRAGKLQLKSPDAQRLLFEGALRRLKLVHQCATLIFELIPPDTNRPPRERSVSLVTLCLQAHFFNIFGFIDCLAHVWVLERNITSVKGKPLPRTKIGFGPGNEYLRSTLPLKAQTILASCDDWFKYLETYRHSIAHRIPLYVPPHFVDPRHADEYSRLSMAWLTEIDDEECARLQKEMDAISHFKSLALFDLSEAPSILFHPQVIVDRKTIDLIASAVFDALGSGPIDLPSAA